METKRANKQTVTSIKYKGLTISVNSFLIALISVIFIFIVTIVCIVSYYQYKFTQLQLVHSNELKAYKN